MKIMMVLEIDAGGRRETTLSFGVATSNIGDSKGRPGGGHGPPC